MISMYKDIIQIEEQDIREMSIEPKEYYEMADFVIKNPQDFILPTKTRIPLDGTDYFNVMPCIVPSCQLGGVKIVTRSEERRRLQQSNIDSDIFLYDLKTLSMKAIVDGSYITTIRTAAVAVHSILNFAHYKDTIAMVGLGKIGNAIGEILFDVAKNQPFTIKLYKYKDQAEKFIRRFEHYKNITFKLCETYEELMKDSDVVVSSVTYISGDFCPASFYKPGCTVIPVHLRGFMECDRTFDHIITSDLESIKKFGYYNEFKKLTPVNDIVAHRQIVRSNPDERVLVYNLGLASFDIYYAAKIYNVLLNK